MTDNMELINNINGTKQLYPNVYHDIVPLQLLQFINGFMVNCNLPTSISSEIQTLYETIAMQIYNFSNTKKKILLVGTERKTIIAYCIYKTCILHNIKCDKYGICKDMGITKKRMTDIHQRHNLP